VIEQANAEAIRDALLVKLDAAVKEHYRLKWESDRLQGIWDDANARKVAATAEDAYLAGSKDTATATGTRAAQVITFYKGYLDTAQAVLDATVAQEGTFDEDIAAAEERSSNAEAARVAAVEVCKHRRYAEAMEALKKAN